MLCGLCLCQELDSNRDTVSWEPARYGCLNVIKINKIYFSVAPATFQMLNSHVWLVDTVLDSADLDRQYPSLQAVLLGGLLRRVQEAMRTKCSVQSRALNER